MSQKTPLWGLGLICFYLLAMSRVPDFGVVVAVVMVVVVFVVVVRTVFLNRNAWRELFIFG